eukprot:TRINITY_DN3444_c0_g1_i4.p1 TRINITY_DN3444_c0_g1~~TRINITY_DN3444_c0_g1_i4.p1  ORF type:complete len:459 (+),score=91.93 TRINITY_DN3444_c0_g1_i4:36-1379(+)
MRGLILSFSLLVIVFADNLKSVYDKEDTDNEGGQGHGFRVPQDRDDDRSYPSHGENTNQGHPAPRDGPTNHRDGPTNHRDSPINHRDGPHPMNLDGPRPTNRAGPAPHRPQRIPPHRPHPDHNQDAHIPQIVIPDLDISQGEILGHYPSNEDIYELAYKLGYRGDLDEGAYAPKGTLHGAKFSKELKSLLSSNDYDLNAHEESYATGYIGGKQTGEKEGYNHGEERGYHEGNERGYEDGHREGFHVGQDEGFDSGQEAGAVIGFVGSYQLAVEKGIRVGMRKGYRDAYHRGYGDGSREGYEDGLKEGLTKALEAVKKGRNPEELLEELAEHPHENPRPHRPIEVPVLHEEEFLNLPHRVREGRGDHGREDHGRGDHGREYQDEPRRVSREHYGSEHHHSTPTPLHNTTEHHHHNSTHHSTPTPVGNTTATPTPVHYHHRWDDDDYDN